MSPAARNDPSRWLVAEASAANVRPVEIGNGTLTGNGIVVRYSADDPTALLTAYLRLIRSIRRQTRTPAIALRRDDIVELARHLDLEEADVVDRLTALMGATASQRATVAMLFAAGAIVVGLGSAGHASATVPPARESAVVAVVAADAAGLVGAVRTVVPVEVAETVSASTRGPIVPSNCNPDATGAVMTLTIPGIADGCPVRAGGQALIDAGFVTLVTDAGVSPVLATRPGDPGTLWLAGHRTTHGAAFADVPDLADGAVITVSADGVVAEYRVVGRAYVEVRNDRVVDALGQPTAEATWKSVIRADLSGDLAPRLVLQTCEGANFRWMVYADLIPAA